MPVSAKLLPYLGLLTFETPEAPTKAVLRPKNYVKPQQHMVVLQQRISQFGRVQEQ